jgi:hypothetical protein
MGNSTSIIAIAPRLPPAIDGVGDYAFRLASQLHQDFGIQTQFVVADPTWTGGAETTHNSAAAIAVRTQAALLRSLTERSATTVLLHYVPHGYARKACPFWLVKALEAWKTGATNRCLITFFHELYALDWHRPWSSDFWLSPIQQYLAARLTELSDVCLTSTERYTRDIARLSRGQHPHSPALPIFSNVGEPLAISPLAQRQRHLVIFGQRHSKGRIYQKSGAALEQICRSLTIEQIFDLGPRSGFAPATISSLPVQELGELPATQVSQVLAQSLVGFLTYDPWRLSKSGIFAAYCAHGLWPINPQGLAQAVDGLQAGIHYSVSHPFASLDLEQGQAIADNALAWYQSHRLAKQSQTFATWLTAPYTHSTVPSGASNA